LPHLNNLLTAPINGFTVNLASLLFYHFSDGGLSMPLMKRASKSSNGHQATSAAPESPPASLTTTRRQLLRGVGGAGIASLIVPTIGWREAAAQSAAAAVTSASQPWTFWVSSFNGEVLSLTGLQANGSIVSAGLRVPIITQRSPDRSALISADIAHEAGSQAHRLVVRSASDGRVLHRILGKAGAVTTGEAVAGHELALAVSADGTYAAVLDTVWTIAGQSPLAAKGGPESRNGPAELVNHLASATSIEVFSLGSGSAIGHHFLTTGALSQSGGFAGHSVLATWTEPGPEQTIRLLSQPAASFGSAPMRHVRAAGMAPASGLQQSHSQLWVQSAGFNAIQFVNSSLQAGRVGVFPDEWGAAKPFPTRLIGLADGKLLIVNCGIPAAAIIEGNSPHVVSKTMLANQPGNPRLALGEWTADAVGRRLYVADSSARQGGIWVYDLPSLRLADRWMSGTAFSAVSAAPDGSAIFAVAREHPLVFSITADGTTVAATELPEQPSGILN
jgi:hypothetical protein